ncbi:hypothetical protein AURDEDRAFT_126502 [Auricularia subglabra TFB-10046 SS5]|nr:hypothetical protein AURDEDRAFT_126502 [Auricularia subglabra TFB-10046 SS5]
MTVDPNRFAGPAEAAILREHIANETSDLDRVNGRLERARRALHDADLALRMAQEAADSARAIVAQGEAHANALLESIGRARGLIHPVRRVPDEILSQILLDWLASEDSEMIACLDYRYFQCIPFTASSICRRWRRVALGTPSLWTRFSLSLSEVQQSSEPWLQYARTHYERSGRSLFNIRLTTWTYDEQASDRFTSLIWATLTVMSHRCRSLSVQCMDGIQDPRLKEFLRGRAPVLETFELVSYAAISDTYPPIQIFDDLPCLKNLHLDCADILWDKGRRFSGATKLYLVPDGIAPMDVAQLALVANRLPNLEQFIFKHSLATTSASSEVIFSTLRCLEIIGNVGEEAAQCLRFPALEKAKLSYMRSPKRLISLALSHSANLSELYLVRACLSAGLAEAIVLLRRLQELETKQSSVTDEFFRRLAQRDADGTWPCPLLHRLHVTAVVPKDRETFDGSSLIALIKARRAASGTVAALRDVKATWGKDMDYSKESFQEELQRLIA